MRRSGASAHGRQAAEHFGHDGPRMSPPAPAPELARVGRANLPNRGRLAALGLRRAPRRALRGGAVAARGSAPAGSSSALEIALVLAPLLYHSGYGFVLLLRGERRRRLPLGQVQRWTSPLLLLFLIDHVVRLLAPAQRVSAPEDTHALLVPRALEHHNAGAGLRSRPFNAWAPPCSRSTSASASTVRTSRGCGSLAAPRTRAFLVQRPSGCSCSFSVRSRSSAYAAVSPSVRLSAELMLPGPARRHGSAVPARGLQRISASISTRTTSPCSIWSSS